ncbi:DNA repair protein RecN [bacterium F16]|nr:DNA repair protein RecN [bacterium F16]
MLAHLQIKNLALIESLDLDLDPGLNIISGETGAGKSIMIGAVQLLFGQRADRSLIRTGTESCDVSAVIECPDPLIREINMALEENGAELCDGNQLIIRRKITEQSGRNFVNGTPATVKLLKQLRDMLLDIHGPYDNQSLLKVTRQLDILDDFASAGSLRLHCAEAFAGWQELQSKLEALDNESPSPELIEYLTFQVREIETVAPMPDEEDALSARHAKAAHSRQILETIQATQTILSENEGCVVDNMGSALRALEDLRRIDKEATERFCSAIEDAVTILSELDSDLYSYAESIEIDPAEFQRMEDRLADLNRLKRKYGGTIESVLQHADECRDKLQQLEHFDDYREELNGNINTARQAVVKHSAVLTETRQGAAKKLGPQISKKLKFLGFPDALFTISVSESEPGPTGADRIDFMFAPNPGEGMKPLRDIASSGEISRVMLALKTVLAQEDKVPILIFDEVDANIGGNVANRVGEELRRLGESHQVICITHQPQVAANAHRHYTVEKSVQKKRTVTTVTELSHEQRVGELARMLGGEESATVVNDHAAELIARAIAVG